MFLKKISLSQEEDNELVDFCLLSNHTILDLLVSDSTKDIKVDQPFNYVTLAENV